MHLNNPNDIPSSHVIYWKCVLIMWNEEQIWQRERWDCLHWLARVSTYERSVHEREFELCSINNRRWCTPYLELARLQMVRQAVVVITVWKIQLHVESLFCICQAVFLSCHPVTHVLRSFWWSYENIYHFHSIVLQVIIWALIFTIWSHRDRFLEGHEVITLCQRIFKWFQPRYYICHNSWNNANHIFSAFPFDWSIIRCNDAISE